MPKGGLSHYMVVEGLVNDYKIRKMAEIGVYRGRLARHICRRCRHIQEYYAIDQWICVEGADFGHHAEKTQEEWDALYRRACREMPYQRALKMLKIPGVQAAKEIFPLKHFKGFFDFAYIDSSHHYQETYDEIKAWLPLVHEGGLIGGHDYAATRPEHQGVRQAVDEVFGKENVKEGDDMVWYVEVKG